MDDPALKVGPGQHTDLRQFRTSGTTGESTAWWRSEAQLHREVDVVRRATALLDVDHIVCFAPPKHLYGYLYGVLLPRLHDLPVVDAWHDPLVPNALRAGDAPLLVCVPSTWSILNHSVSWLRAMHRLTALHSTASLPRVATQVAASLPRIRVVEVFGSTETGAVAWRSTPGAALRYSAGGGAATAWTLFDDVVLAGLHHCPEVVQPLNVRSPRLARRSARDPVPTEHQMDDLVRVLTTRTFLFDGRRARTVNIDGCRCDLDKVEQLLRQWVPKAEVLCVPHRDPIRGENFRVEVSGREPERLAATVRELLDTRLHHLPQPDVVTAVTYLNESLRGQPRRLEPEP